MKRPKAPQPTAEDKAMVMRQQAALDEEIAEGEKRLKAVARGTLGTKSLLAKASTPKAAKKRSGIGGGGYMGSGVGRGMFGMSASQIASAQAQANARSGTA